MVKLPGILVHVSFVKAYLLCKKIYNNKLIIELSLIKIDTKVKVDVLVLKVSLCAFNDI